MKIFGQPTKLGTPSKWVDVIRTGTVVIICGIGAITILFRNIGIACIVGIIGIAIGAATLKIDAEKSDRLLARIGIFLSLIPILYAIVLLVKK